MLIVVYINSKTKLRFEHYTIDLQFGCFQFNMPYGPMNPIIMKEFYDRFQLRDTAKKPPQINLPLQNYKTRIFRKCLFDTHTISCKSFSVVK